LKLHWDAPGAVAFGNFLKDQREGIGFEYREVAAFFSLPRNPTNGLFFR
jgi:hypothetical protein